MDEDEKEDSAPTLPKAGSSQIVGIPGNADTAMVPKVAFPGQDDPSTPPLGTAANPVNLSDAPTEASTQGACPEGADAEDEAKILGHFSDAPDEMAQSIADLEDGYFLALWEVIRETEKALWDISHIDLHYISQVVMVMSSWQEAVQAAASHMETTDTAIYFACHEDVQRATKEYVKEVIKAHDERDATHAQEQEIQKRAIQTGDPEDPVVCLLEATCRAAHMQANRAVDAFLDKIKETLKKHIPMGAQGLLIANALSTCMQFRMSVWWMLGDECMRPLHTHHLDWCGLAGIVQAIVETFPNNCTIMFPVAPVPDVVFSSTFWPASSDEDDDNDGDNSSHGAGFRRFDEDPSMPSGSGRGLPFASTPLSRGGSSSLPQGRQEHPVVPLVRRT